MILLYDTRYQWTGKKKTWYIDYKTFLEDYIYFIYFTEELIYITRKEDIAEDSVSISETSQAWIQMSPYH